MQTVIDYETVSGVDLQRCGSYRYIENAKFGILCRAELNSYKTIFVPFSYRIALPDSIGDWKITRADVSSPLDCIAHNAIGFESVIAPDRQWTDTMAQCLQHCLPGGLNAACIHLGLGHKTENRRIFSLFKPGVVGTPALWLLLLRYCANDVELTAKLHKALPSCQEPDVIALDREINGRGVRVDRERVNWLLNLYEDDRRENAKGLSDLGLTESEAWSNSQMLAWLRQKCRVDLTAKGIGREAVKQFLESPDDYTDSDSPDIQRAIAALERRRQMVRVGPSKLLRLLDITCADGRLRGSLAYYGAGRTGRWAGRGMQPHNLPKAPVNLLLPKGERKMNWGLRDYADVRAEAERLACQPADILGALVRSVFVGDLCWADFSQIEARIALWLAGESWPDAPYEETARVIGSDRQLGKIVFLGSQYGMGAHRLAATAGLDFKQARQCIKAYRERFSRIPRLWRQLHKIGLQSVDIAVQAFGCRWERDSAGLRLYLPSGRYLYYRGARIEQRIAKWRALYGAPAETECTFVYDHPRYGIGRGEMYGGKWLENIVQAIARDCLVETLRAVREHCVLHVHDEVVLDGGSLSALSDAMRAEIPWARGLKLECEGWNGERYEKK